MVAKTKKNKADKKNKAVSKYHDTTGHSVEDSNTDLSFHDKIIEMMAPGHLNVYRYIGPPEGYGDHIQEDFPHDGLVRAPIGFYRLAEDVETGNKILLFSYDANKLDGEKNEDGEKRLTESEGVCVIAARPHIKDVRWIESEILDHQHTLQTWRLHHLNLYVENKTMLSKEEKEKEHEKDAEESLDAAKPKPKRTIKMSNSDLGYGLFEKDDNTWDINLYITSDKDTVVAENSGSFVEVGNNPTFDNFFSLRKELGHANTLDEATKLVEKDFYVRAHRLWKGESALPPSEDWTVNFKKKVINFIKAPAKKGKVFKASVPLIAAGIVGMAGFMLSGGLLMVGGVSAAISGLLTTMVGVLAEHVAEETLEKSIGKILGEKSQEEKNKTLPIHEREMSYMYTDELDEMLNPNIKADKINQLRPLTDREANMRPPLTAPTLFLSDSYAEEWLFGSMSGAFGAVVFPVNEESFSIQYPNGIVTLYNTEDRSVHVRMRDHLRIENSDDFTSPPLPEKVLDLLKDGEILKISLSHNGFDSSQKTYAEFSEEIQNIVATTPASPEDKKQEHKPNYRTRRAMMKSYPLQSIRDMFCAVSKKPPKDDKPPKQTAKAPHHTPTPENVGKRK